MGKYEYLPLGQDQGSIRILKLLPSKGRKNIECELIDAVIGLQTFSAVSYEWGDASCSHIIQINGQDFTIRSNLWYFLRRYRHILKIRYLWIDAICINQDDIKERGRQVEKMGDIYRSATKVLIWLGPYKKFCSPIARYAHFGLMRVNKGLTNFPWGGGGFKFDVMEFLDDVTGFFAPGFWPLIYEMCKREYWDRAWIVQEVMSAREARIYVGDTSMSWKTFMIAIREFRERKEQKFRVMNGEDSFSVLRSPSPIYRPLWLQRHWYPVEHLRLPTLLNIHIAKRCKFPRDRIYSLRGLDSQASRDMRVSYEDTTLEVFEDVLEFTNPYNPLDFCFLLKDALELSKDHLREGKKQRLQIQGKTFKLRPTINVPPHKMPNQWPSERKAPAHSRNQRCFDRFWLSPDLAICEDSTLSTYITPFRDMHDNFLLWELHPMKGVDWIFQEYDDSIILCVGLGIWIKKPSPSYSQCCDYRELIPFRFTNYFEPVYVSQDDRGYFIPASAEMLAFFVVFCTWTNLHGIKITGHNKFLDELLVEAYGGTQAKRYTSMSSTNPGDRGIADHRAYRVSPDIVEQRRSI